MKFLCTRCGNTLKADSVYELAEKGQIDFGCDINEYEANETGENIIYCCPKCYYSDYYYDKTQKEGQKRFDEAVNSLSVLLQTENPDDPVELAIDVIERHNEILHLCKEYETLFGEEEKDLNAVDERIEEILGTQWEEGVLETEKIEIYYDDHGYLHYILEEGET